MKNLLFLTITLFIINLQAQEVTKNFVPYYFNDGNATPFERKAAKLEAKAIGMGYGGVNQYLTIFNSKNSNVRFTKDSLPKFIIQLDEGTDALDLVVISKADIVKKRKTYRRFIQQGSAMGGGSKDMSNYHIIPELIKIKDNLYEMKFLNTLEAGEYSFLPIYKGEESVNIQSTSGAVRIYCFGID